MSAIPHPGRARSRPRTVKRGGVVVVLAGLAAASVGGAAATLGTGGSSTAATTTSRTVTVSNGVVQETVSGSGNLAALHDSSLNFDEAGEITKVYVKAGQHVTEGEALLRLQPTDTSADVTWLRAPYSGTVASLGVAKGDQVTGTTSATSTAAIEVVQLKTYNLQVSLSESDVGKVKVGQVATVTVSATGEKLAAKVTSVGVLSSSSTSSTAATSSPRVRAPSPTR